MAEEAVVGVYGSLNEAEAAVRSLRDGGFPIQRVSIIATHIVDGQRVHGFITASDVARWSATTGAWVGGIFGLLVGAAFLWVPTFGPLIIVGSLSAILLGGLEGAVAGAAVSGALGWLVGLGVSAEHVRKYEDAIKAGKLLVIAHGSEDVVKHAREILASSNAEQLHSHPTTVGHGAG